MEDENYRRYERPFGNDTHRFGDWLRGRPAESWIFFAAGIFIGGLFF